MLSAQYICFYVHILFKTPHFLPVHSNLILMYFYSYFIIFSHLFLCLLFHSVLAVYPFYRYIYSTITYNSLVIQLFVFYFPRNIMVWNLPFSCDTRRFRDYYTNHLYEIHSFLISVLFSENIFLS